MARSRCSAPPPAGVVLSNQSDRNLCGWLPFARVLANLGFQALLYDYGIAGDERDDLAAAVAALRGLGAERVALLGASQGAKASLVAASGIRPPVAGVASLSAERTYTAPTWSPQPPASVCRSCW
jgi:hypothetical protein